MFDFRYPRIICKIFKEYYWFDFYRYAKEAIPPNMDETREQEVYSYMLVDADLAGDKSNMSSQTGVFIFTNKDPIHWYRNRQSTVEASTFGEDFCTIKAGMERVNALRYKL